MKLFSVAVFLFAASSGLAAPRIMSAAAGDCDDADLRSASRLFADALSRRLTTQVLDADAAGNRLKPRSIKSRDEIQRQLASAQTQFYNLQYLKANQQVLDALEEISRLPPNRDRWSLNVSAQLLRGMIMLGAKQNAQATDAFTKVLALEPNYQLDVDYYSPSTRASFDKVRQDLAKQKRGTLQVRSTPSGADVFVDGFLVGKTPYSGKLPAAKYQVLVGRNNTFSFARNAQLTDSASVHVDLEFEGSVKSGPTLCITETATAHDRVSDAVKLGALLEVDEVVLVRVRRQTPAAQWFTATLISVTGGHEVREGGLKMETSGPATQVEDLVSYIATGQAAPSVVVASQGGPNAAPWHSGAVASDAPKPPRASDTSVPLKPLARDTDVQASVSGGRGLREKAWIPAVGGAVLIGGGAVFYVLAQGVHTDIVDRDPSITHVDDAVSRGKLYQGLAWGLGLTGVAAFGAAGAMYLLDAPSPSASASIVPTQGGAMATLGGQF